MKKYQMLNKNHNSLSFNNEIQNLKSHNQSIVIEDNKKNYIEYFDWIRIFSSFGVILIHVSEQNYYGNTPGKYEWKVLTFMIVLLDGVYLNFL